MERSVYLPRYGFRLTIFYQIIYYVQIVWNLGCNRGRGGEDEARKIEKDYYGYVAERNARFSLLLISFPLFF